MATVNKRTVEDLTSKATVVKKRSVLFDTNFLRTDRLYYKDLPADSYNVSKEKLCKKFNVFNLRMRELKCSCSSDCKHTPSYEHQCETIVEFQSLRTLYEGKNIEDSDILTLIPLLYFADKYEYAYIDNLVTLFVTIYNQSSVDQCIKIISMVKEFYHDSVCKFPAFKGLNIITPAFDTIKKEEFLELIKIIPSINVVNGINYGYGNIIWVFMHQEGLILTEVIDHLCSKGITNETLSIFNLQFNGSKLLPVVHSRLYKLVKHVSQKYTSDPKCARLIACICNIFKE